MNQKITFNNMPKTILAIVLMLALTIVTLAGCSTGNHLNQGANAVTSTNSAKPNPSTDTDGDGLPDSVEKTYGTNPYTADTDGDGVNDKEDKTPVSSEKLINETSTAAVPMVIKDAKVEDNATADHLEITVTNTGNTTLDNFDIYYTVTDEVTQSKEAYYQILSGLSLNAGETKTIHFDNQVQEAGHYYGNMNGLYGSSQNALMFDIQLHANGYQPLNFQVEKSKGTAEVAD
jgi:hypothetical protein